MKLSELPSKQKKLQSIRTILEQSLVNSPLRSKAEDSLQVYQNLLLRIWEKQVAHDQGNGEEAIGDEDLLALQALERELDRLSESLRLFAKPS